jgi:enoyl-CoA hydratase/carnithine racemase
MDKMFETIDTEFDEETGIGYLTLDRPDSLNALSLELREEIIEGLRALNDLNDNGIDMRVVVIEGADGNFCAGADITEFEDEALTTDVDRTHFQFIRDYPVPVIAKICGYCLGGGLETAMSCDFRFASEGATLGLPEVDLGIIPGAGGVQYISRLADPSTALEIAMTGDHISAEQAAEAGIINRVYDEEELNDGVEKFASKIASKPPLSIQTLKESAYMATEVGLEEGLDYDRKLCEPLFGTEDHEEGVKAFAEDDYEPEFKGR